MDPRWPLGDPGVAQWTPEVLQRPFWEHLGAQKVPKWFPKCSKEALLGASWVPKGPNMAPPKLPRRSFGSILGPKMPPKDLRKHQRLKIEGPRSNLQGSRPKVEGPKSVATKIGARVRRDSRSVNNYLDVFKNA